MKHDTPSHPKFLVLKNILRMPHYQVCGILESLWNYATRSAQDGILRQSRQFIAVALEWPDNYNEIFDALETAGWIDRDDETLSIHGWIEHRPDFIRLRQNRKEKYQKRRTTSDMSDDVGQRRTNSTTSDMSDNVPINRTEQNRNISLIPVSQSMSDIDVNDKPTDCSTAVERPVSARPKLSNGHQKSFDAFWAAWPRKAGKGAAEAWWIRNKPNAETVSAIMAAIELQRHCDQWTRDGGQFIPHPTTWLNQKRWLDEPTVTGDTYHDTVTGDVAAREAEFEAWMDRVDVQR